MELKHESITLSSLVRQARNPTCSILICFSREGGGVLAPGFLRSLYRRVQGILRSLICNCIRKRIRTVLKFKSKVAMIWDKSEMNWGRLQHYRMQFIYISAEAGAVIPTSQTSGGLNLPPWVGPPSTKNLIPHNTLSRPKMIFVVNG